MVLGDMPSAGIHCERRLCVFAQSSCPVTGCTCRGGYSPLHKPSMLTLLMNINRKFPVSGQVGYLDIPGFAPGEMSERCFFVLVFDKEAAVKYLVFYVAASPRAYDEIAAISEAYVPLLTSPVRMKLQYDAGSEVTRFIHASILTSDTVYHDNVFSPQQQTDLAAIFLKARARLELLGPSLADQVFEAIKNGKQGPLPDFEIRNGMPMPVGTQKLPLIGPGGTLSSDGPPVFDLPHLPERTIILPANRSH